MEAKSKFEKEHVTTKMIEDKNIKIKYKTT